MSNHSSTLKDSKKKKYVQFFLNAISGSHVGRTRGLKRSKVVLTWICLKVSPNHVSDGCVSLHSLICRITKMEGNYRRLIDQPIDHDVTGHYQANGNWPLTQYLFVMWQCKVLFFVNPHKQTHNLEPLSRKSQHLEFTPAQSRSLHLTFQQALNIRTRVDHFNVKWKYFPILCVSTLYTQHPQIDPSITLNSSVYLCVHLNVFDREGFLLCCLPN